ncbi:unnamed protein product [Rotaria sp. Silwood2]|nr:unnamed protein product [Rotaria sp. Silwood2]CAF3079545.1 unnamed protein product [Rotaria sp. Silwood2]CAF3422447.1 unnamed protein product [Rotaria sp. Silwood2]
MYRLGLLLLLFNVVDAESHSSTLILSGLGTIFQPVNIIELIRTFNANTLLHCSIKCNNDVHCRTIDYDSISKQCRHFAGEISTGTIISSNSPTSTVGVESTFMETSAFTSSLSTSSTITNSSILINYTNVYPAPVASPNAAAQLYSVNLLMNGDGETGPCAMSINVTHPTVWSYVGTITQISYNDYEYGALDPTSPGPSDRGNCYFCGMFDAVTTMSQSIDLFPYATAIASGNVSFNLSAWLGGWTNQDDSAKVSVNFLDYAYQPVGNQTTIGPVLAADRGFTSSLIFRQNSGMIPINTRYMTVIVTLIWHSGSENDGYIDNISVKLRYS